jgi:hypothetical protein
MLRFLIAFQRTAFPLQVLIAAVPDWSEKNAEDVNSRCAISFREAGSVDRLAQSHSFRNPILPDVSILSRLHRISRRGCVRCASRLEYNGRMVARSFIISSAGQIWARTADATMSVEVVHA